MWEHVEGSSIYELKFSYCIKLLVVSHFNSDNLIGKYDIFINDCKVMEFKGTVEEMKLQGLLIIACFIETIKSELSEFVSEIK